MFVIKEKYARQELVVKKSRFIASVFYVESEEEVKSIIDKIRKEFYDARHNCYAYIIGDKKKASDDGEPQGTAGKPILTLLEGKSLTNCLIIVSRIFGGILLGTGGLTHAYGDTAKMALDTCNILELIDGSKITVRIKYDMLSKVKSTIESYDKAKIDNIDYGDLIVIDFSVAKESTEILKNKLLDITSGQIEFINENDIKYVI